MCSAAHTALAEDGCIKVGAGKSSHLGRRPLERQSEPRVVLSRAERGKRSAVQSYIPARRRQPLVDMTTQGCHAVGMTINTTHQPTFDRIREVRAEAIKHTMLARQFAAERRDLMQGLIKDGVSQADIARELGVTRQAIQKMLAC